MVAALAGSCVACCNPRHRRWPLSCRACIAAVQAKQAKRARCNGALQAHAELTAVCTFPSCSPCCVQAKQDASALQEQSKEFKLKIKEAEELEKRVGGWGGGCTVVALCWKQPLAEHAKLFLPA